MFRAYWAVVKEWEEASVKTKEEKNSPGEQKNLKILGLAAWKSPSDTSVSKDILTSDAEVEHTCKVQHVIYVDS